jgi:SAM-dependent methyltransferase
MNPSGREQFMALLAESVAASTLVKLTLGKPADKAAEAAENLFVRPVTLKAGPQLAFVWRHETKDITKNYGAEEAMKILDGMIGVSFLDGHLFTTTQNAQLETSAGKSRFRLRAHAAGKSPVKGNDRPKEHAIDPSAPWLAALGVTGGHGRPVAGMADKFRQIENFAEILSHLLAAAPLPRRRLQVYDMGCGKGYLTFAASELLGDRAEVVGIEARAELVDLCNGVARAQGIAHRLSFRTGTIADTVIGSADILIALHACDTATDDALARGISLGAALMVVAPCCQKEIRPQLTPPAVLSGALKHGIFAERQAEFATDALRALLLEWSGYTTRVIEFISTEHTPKNVMITAVKGRPSGDPSAAARIRDFAAFYGIRRQALAGHLGVDLG